MSTNDLAVLKPLSRNIDQGNHQRTSVKIDWKGCLSQRNSSESLEPKPLGVFSEDFYGAAMHFSSESTKMNLATCT